MVPIEISELRGKRADQIPARASKNDLMIGSKGIFNKFIQIDTVKK